MSNITIEGITMRHFQLLFGMFFLVTSSCFAGDVTKEAIQNDNELNAAYERVMSSLLEPQKKQLRDAQRLWIKYRDATCDFEGSLPKSAHWVEQNGSGARSLECISRLSSVRASELDAYLESSRGKPFAGEPATAGAQDTFKKDAFVMPESGSDIPFRFALTTDVVNKEPVSSLPSIDIGRNQKSLVVYVKLTGVDAQSAYELRFRALDAKGELVFDKAHTINTSSNSAWFAAKITPMLNVDEAGQWTFQGVLNGKTLFVEKRQVRF